jgi:hypothetical protein
MSTSVVVYVPAICSRFFLGYCECHVRKHTEQKKCDRGDNESALHLPLPSSFVCFVSVGFRAHLTSSRPPPEPLFGPRLLDAYSADIAKFAKDVACADLFKAQP